ncbi:MAG TPA: hypothetical protein VHX17_08355 [Candidatus Cybelea sp.]|jgi:hypothetical protein|nr:hypothetical protein [Candidatus Cybelea sp.]
MTLAIRGDRTSCLSLQLGPGTWLLAVARGFGQIGGLPTETAFLSRLKLECQRRMRSPRFRRAIDRPQAAATAMLAIMGRVNGALYACTASHDDYVTAAASVTAVIVVARYAYVIHAGATAAYLARNGEIIPLCADDGLDDPQIPVLSRAFATGPALDVSVSNARLAPGDAIVLIGRRVASEMEVRALLARLEESELAEQVLVARFEDDGAPAPLRVTSARLRFWPLLLRGLALIGFVAAAVIAH